MRISGTMRDALQELSGRGGSIRITKANGETSYVFDRSEQTADARTVSALRARKLIAEDGGRYVATDAGRQVLADEFRERREALPVPLDWKGGTYWTRPRFAELAGVSPTAVFMWEKGDRPITDSTWRALEAIELRLWLAYTFPLELEGALQQEGVHVHDAGDAIVRRILATAPADVAALFEVALTQREQAVF